MDSQHQSNHPPSALPAMPTPRFWVLEVLPTKTPAGNREMTNEEHVKGKKQHQAISYKHCWFQCFLVLLFPLRENVVIERNIKLGLITESSILKRMLSA